MGGWVLAQGANTTVDPKLAHDYAQLEAQAANRQGAKQAEALAKLAEMDFDFAHAGYLANQTTEGDQQLDRATQHADQACAVLKTEAARGKTGGVRNVEISLQRVTYGLKDLAQRVHFRQRPKVEAVGSHFADLRAELLDMMFAPKPSKGS